VPVRIEVGPRDMASQMCRIVRRDTGALINNLFVCLPVSNTLHYSGEKLDVPVAGLHEYIANLLNEIHKYLFTKASIERDQKIVRVTEWKDFVPALNDNCLAYTPFCDIGEWEERVKVMSRDEALCGSTESATVATSVAAKTLCKPFDQPPLPEGTKCFVSGLPATTWILWGRSY
jgi:prolyl-tRNA synthetase